MTAACVCGMFYRLFDFSKGKGDGDDSVKGVQGI